MVRCRVPAGREGLKPSFIVSPLRYSKPPFNLLKSNQGCRGKWSRNTPFSPMLPCAISWSGQISGRVWYSVLTHLKVLRAHPSLCSKCSPILRYSVLTNHEVLRNHPSRYYVITHPRCSVHTPSKILRTRPFPSAPCSPHPRYYMSTLFKMLRADPIQGNPCPFQVFHAHPIQDTTRSPYPRRSMPARL